MALPARTPWCRRTISRRRRTATKAAALLAGLALLCGAGLPPAALAGQVAATVVQLSGPLAAHKPDGSRTALALRSEVESGDTLVTPAGSYAQLRFIDSSEIIMKPSTTLAVAQFAFAHGQPEADSASLQLVRGGLRSVSGLLGRRSKEKFFIKTPAATIGIRGTIFILEYIDGPEQQAAASETAPLQGSPLIPPAPVPPGALPPGLHVYVNEGGISVTNEAGQGLYDPGQFGFIKDFRTKPFKMTANPGIQFSPPASFLPVPPAAVR